MSAPELSGGGRPSLPVAAGDHHRYLVADEVAEILRVSPKTIRDWRLKGQGPRSFKVGGRVLWKTADVHAFADQQHDNASA